MKNASPLSSDSLRAFLSRAGLPRDDGIVGLYATAIEKSLISVTDALTARDILRVAGADGTATSAMEGLDSSARAAMHALLISMFSCRNQGSVCLPLEEAVLTIEFRPYCGGLTDHFVKNVMTLASSSMTLIRGDGGPWPLVVSAGRLYFQRSFLHESSLKGGIDRLLDTGGTRPGMPDAATALAIVDRVSSFERAGCVCALSDRQKLAVILALRRRFLVVSGGPGTGKTQIIVSLVGAFGEAGVGADEVLLIAPTGRAARRMGESVSAALAETPALSGHTIHSALRYNPGKGSFGYTRHNRLPHRLIVCDEVSMVDVSLMDALVSAIRDDAAVLFLGDRDQLPSVDSGAVLSDLVPAVAKPVFSASAIDLATKAGIDAGGLTLGSGRMVDAIVILDRSYRAAGDVLNRAGRVNRGDIEALDGIYPGITATAEDGADWGDPGAMCRGILPPDVYHGLPALLDSWGRWLLKEVSSAMVPSASRSRGFKGIIAAVGARQVGPEPDPDDLEWLAALSRVLDRGRILCALREGLTGAVGVNRVMRNLAGAEDDIFPGCPVMVARNSPAHGLFNGDTGIAVQSPQGLLAWFRQPGGFVSVPVRGEVELVPAFAITVHKSQGSEYENVLVVLPDDPDHPLMTREILYTAMTRASNNVWFLARPVCLRGAIRKKSSRYSGIDLWA